MARYTTRYMVLSVADSAIAFLVVFPLTCMYWRGIWDLIDYYFFPDFNPLTLWVQTAVGFLQVVGIIVLPVLDQHLDRSKTVSFVLISRVFMYLHALTYMFYWHGLWELVDHYFGVQWQYSLAVLVFAWFSLALLGGCRTAMWPPFFIFLDNHPKLLQTQTRFETKVINPNVFYLQDGYIIIHTSMAGVGILWSPGGAMRKIIIEPRAVRISKSCARFSKSCARLSNPCARISNPCARFSNPCARISNPCARFSNPCARINYDNPCARITKPCARITKPCARITKSCARITKSCAQISNPCARFSNPCARISVIIFGM